MKISFELRNDKQDKTGTVPIYVVACFDGVRLRCSTPSPLTAGAGAVGGVERDGTGTEIDRSRLKGPAADRPGAGG